MKLRTNRIKAQLRAGRTAVGINVQTASPEIVEMVGGAGYDYAMLDWEHGSYGFDTLVQLIRAADAVDLTAIVRVPDANPTNIMRVLDAGAQGVVVPQISSPEEAAAAVLATQYFDGANLGQRGACPSVRATGHMATDWPAYVQHSNREVFVALGFETVDAIAQCEAILATRPVDAVFIGAFDLAQSIGIPGGMYHPENMKYIRDLCERSRALEVPIFATLVSGTADEAATDMTMWRELGARVVNVMSDRRVLTLGLAQRHAAVTAG